MKKNDNFLKTIERFPIIIHLGRYVSMVMEAMYSWVSSPPPLSSIISHMRDIGVGSLGVVAITGFCSGMVLAAQAFYQLSGTGLLSIVGVTVGKAMVVEIGPVLTAFMVTGRVGAATCAEIGSMCVSEQIHAMQSMAVSPIRYLISPRLLAGMITIPMLMLFSTFTGIFGAALLSCYFFHMSFYLFFEPLCSQVTFFDFFAGLIKSAIFGTLIMSIACYKGLSTQDGARGVGQSTTSSVVMSYCFILLSNFILTIFINFANEALLYKNYIR